MNTKTLNICYHCKNEFDSEVIQFDEHKFCCNGCQFVYEILRDNNLGDYYNLKDSTQNKPVQNLDLDYNFLSEQYVIDKLILFQKNNISKVKLRLPDIHCASCLWLLENLPEFFGGVNTVNVNFLEKEAFITFDNTQTNLLEISKILSKIGYPPSFNLSDLDESQFLSDNKKELRSLYIKVGISFFCFGNIMMLAFPEYFSDGDYTHNLKGFIEVLNLLFIIPITYSAWDYFKSAYNSIKYRYISIDIPIALGLVSLVGRSVFEISTGTGPGYVDSYGGFTFFLLLGKLFQIKTYTNIKFERDFRSYFPLSVIKIIDGVKKSVSINEVKQYDELFIRNGEIIPTDSILLSKNAMIDYSFVTGESEPLNIEKGAKIYAGGKLFGNAINLIAEKKYNQSYFTELWDKNNSYNSNNLLEKNLKQNNLKAENIKQNETNLTSISEQVGKRFTIIISLLSILGFLYWVRIDVGIAFNVFTSILVVACPCAIAVSLPFSFGSTLRILGRNGVYFKNNYIVEKLDRINTIILDKTRTLTEINNSKVNLIPNIELNNELTDNDYLAVRLLTENSIHPVSNHISKFINEYIHKLIHSGENVELEKNNLSENNPSGKYMLEQFNEINGKGITGIINGIEYKLGSKSWLFGEDKIKEELLEDKSQNGQNFLNEKGVFLLRDGKYIAKFEIISNFRNGLDKLFDNLIKKYKVIILSGDNDKDKSELDKITNSAISNGTIQAFFENTPDKKAEVIKNLNNNGNFTLMIGDGLNDSMALNSANIGMAVTENNSNFTPGADIIILGDKVTKLYLVLDLAKKTKLTVYLSFGLSFIYNIIGIYFGLRGELTPLLAAIIMPLSSITVVIFNVSLISFFAYKNSFLK